MVEHRGDCWCWFSVCGWNVFSDTRAMRVIISLAAYIIMVTFAYANIIGGSSSWTASPPPPPVTGDPTVGLLPVSINGGNGTYSADGWQNWSVAGLSGIPLSGYISSTTLHVTTSFSGSLGVGHCRSLPGAGCTPGTTTHGGGQRPHEQCANGNRERRNVYDQFLANGRVIRFSNRHDGEWHSQQMCGEWR